MSGAVGYAVATRTPVGAVGVAVGPRGLVALTMAKDAAGAVRALRRDAGSALRPDARAAGPALRQVREFLAGRRRRFTLPIDWDASGTPFQRAVWRATARIPWGTTRTYGQLAAGVGRPGAARAVGQAMGANPRCLAVP